MKKSYLCFVFIMGYLIESCATNIEFSLYVINVDTKELGLGALSGCDSPMLKPLKTPTICEEEVFSFVLGGISPCTDGRFKNPDEQDASGADSIILVPTEIKAVALSVETAVACQPPLADPDADIIVYKSTNADKEKDPLPASLAKMVMCENIICELNQNNDDLAFIAFQKYALDEDQKRNILRMALANKRIKFLLRYLWQPEQEESIGIDFYQGWYIFGFKKSTDIPLPYEPFCIVQKKIARNIVRSFFSYNAVVGAAQKRILITTSGSPNPTRLLFLMPYFVMTPERPR